MKNSPAWTKPLPRFSVGDVVDVKIGRIGVLSPGNWNQGTVTEVRTYLLGPVYTIQAFDGALLKAEERDVQKSDL